VNENAFFAAHRAIPLPAFPDADPQDAVRVPRARTLPRHRARRRVWKPPAPDLQSFEPQHAYDGNSFVR
jgi:hypothetical protein